MRIPMRNAAWNAPIPANGGTVTGVGYIGAWNNVTNNRPARFTLNTTLCAAG